MSTGISTAFSRANKGVKAFGVQTLTRFRGETESEPESESGAACAG